MRSSALASRVLALSSPSRAFGTGWPKPSPRQPVQPYERSEVEARLKKTPIPAEEAEKVMQLEGWLFGRKVIYLNKDKPYYEQLPHEAAYLFGERPLPPGYRRLMADWEIVTYAGIIAAVIMIVITWWAKPETDIFIWAREELRERRILKRSAYADPFSSPDFPLCYPLVVRSLEEGKSA